MYLPTYFLAYVLNVRFQQICPVNVHQLQMEKKNLLFIPIAKKGCVNSIILFRFVNKKSTCRSLASAKEFCHYLVRQLYASLAPSVKQQISKTLKVGDFEENLSLFGKTICITKSSISFFFFSVRNRLLCRFPS